MGDTVFADVCWLSVADLRRRCIALEDERRCLADEIVQPMRTLQREIWAHRARDAKATRGQIA
jgi:hypothetical protein